jgi:hypothetical protein
MDVRYNLGNTTKNAQSNNLNASLEHGNVVCKYVTNKAVIKKDLPNQNQVSLPGESSKCGECFFCWKISFVKVYEC